MEIIVTQEELLEMSDPKITKDDLPEVFVGKPKDEPTIPIVIRKEMNELKSRELELQLKQLEEEKKALDKELLEWMAEQGTPMVRTENFTISLIEKHYVKAKRDDIVGFLEENYPDFVAYTSKAKETEIKSILKEEPEHPLSAVYELVPLHQIQCRKR